MSNLSPEERQVWQQHVDRQQAQGGSLAAYAKQHGLSVSLLYYWRKILVGKKSSPAKGPGFAAVRVATVTESSGCLIQLSPSMTLQCATLPDPNWLAELARQLDSRS